MLKITLSIKQASRVSRLRCHPHEAFSGYRNQLSRTQPNIQPLEARCRPHSCNTGTRGSRNRNAHKFPQAFVDPGKSCKVYQRFNAFYFCKSQACKLKLELAPRLEYIAHQDLNTLCLVQSSLWYRFDTIHSLQQICQSFDRKYRSSAGDHSASYSNQYRIETLELTIHACRHSLQQRKIEQSLPNSA